MLNSLLWNNAIKKQSNKGSFVKCYFNVAEVWDLNNLNRIKLSYGNRFLAKKFGNLAARQERYSDIRREMDIKKYSTREVE